jgi:hypothetical protein
LFLLTYFALYIISLLCDIPVKIRVSRTAGGPRIAWFLLRATVPTVFLLNKKGNIVKKYVNHLKKIITSRISMPCSRKKPSAVLNKWSQAV